MSTKHFIKIGIGFICLIGCLATCVIGCYPKTGTFTDIKELPLIMEGGVGTAAEPIEFIGAENVSLTWTMIDGATCYEVVINEKPVPGIMTVNDQPLECPLENPADWVGKIINFQPDPPLPYSVVPYKWRVRAYNGVQYVDSGLGYFSLTSNTPATATVHISVDPDDATGIEFTEDTEALLAGCYVRVIADIEATAGIQKIYIYHNALKAGNEYIGGISNEVDFYETDPDYTPSTFTYDVVLDHLTPGQENVLKLAVEDPRGGVSVAKTFYIDTLDTPYPKGNRFLEKFTCADNSCADPMTFTWPQSGLNVTYKAMISSEPTFETTIEEESNISATEWLYTDGLADGVYYFKAQVCAGFYCTDIIKDCGTGTCSDSLNFSWLEVDDADSYEVIVSTDSDFSTIYDSQSGITDTSWFIEGLSSGIYYFKVNACVDDFCYRCDNICPMKAGNVTTEPTLTDPQVGLQGCSDQPEVCWTYNGEDGDEVVVQVFEETDTTYEEPVFEGYRSKDSDEVCWRVPEPLLGGYYNWRVAARNTVPCYGTWVYGDKFGVIDPVQLNTPEYEQGKNCNSVEAGYHNPDTDTGGVYLTWELPESPIIDELKVEISQSSSFAGEASNDYQSTTFDSSGGNFQALWDAPIDTTFANQGIIYYWRVVGSDTEDTCEVASEMRCFQFTANPCEVTSAPDPGTLKPDDDVTIIGYPRFTWNALDKAADYAFEIADDAAFAVNQRSNWANDGTATSISLRDLNITIQDGNTYFWHMRGVTEEGDPCGPWSETRKFTVRLPSTTACTESAPVSFQGGNMLGGFGYAGDCALSTDESKIYVTLGSYDGSTINSEIRCFDTATLAPCASPGASFGKSDFASNNLAEVFGVTVNPSNGDIYVSAAAKGSGGSGGADICGIARFNSSGVLQENKEIDLCGPLDFTDAATEEIVCSCRASACNNDKVGAIDPGTLDVNWSQKIPFGKCGIGVYSDDVNNLLFFSSYDASTPGNDGVVSMIYTPGTGVSDGPFKQAKDAQGVLDEMRFPEEFYGKCGSELGGGVTNSYVINSIFEYNKVRFWHWGINNDEIYGVFDIENVRRPIGVVADSDLNVYVVSNTGGDWQNFNEFKVLKFCF